MSKNKHQEKQTESKLSEITFDCKKLGASIEDKSVFGIQVTASGKNKLVGKCDPEIKKALSDAGKCE